MMNTIQQYAGSIMQAIIIGLLGYFGIAMVNLQKEVAVLQAEVASLKTVVTKNTESNYRASDAEHDFTFVFQQLDRMDKRIIHLEDLANGRHFR